MISYNKSSAIDQYNAVLRGSLPPTTRQQRPASRPGGSATFDRAVYRAEATSGLQDSPIEVALFQDGRWVGNGKLGRVALDKVQLETNVDFTRDTYLQIQLQLPRRGAKHRLWGRVIQCTDQGVELAMDVLHPDTLAGLRAVAHSSRHG